MALGVAFMAPLHAQESKNYELLIGSPDAPVTVIEYASLACPHCANFHQTVYPKLKKNFIDTNIAKLYIRDFPHNNAAVVATIVKRCVAEDVQVGLYEMILKEQDEWLTKEDVRVPLRKYAALAGLDEAGMEACLQDKALIADLFSDVKKAEKKKITSVPSIFIDGKKVKADYDSIAKAIEKAR